MKKEQIYEVFKMMPSNPPMIGYFFKAAKHGMGLVEEAKNIANVWNQKFVYINMAQSDMHDVHLLLVEHAKEMEPTTFCFDEMEKASEELRNFIFHRFAISRENYLHPSCHVIYLVNPDENEYYQNPWNDYVMCHSMEINVEA